MKSLPLLRSKQIPLEFQSNPKVYKKYFRVKTQVVTPAISAKHRGVNLSVRRQQAFSTITLTSFLKLLRPKLKEQNRTARAFLSISVDTPITRKAKDIRMGRGKGAPSEKVSILRGGSLLCSLHGLSQNNGYLFAKRIRHKLPGTVATISADK